MKKTLYAWFDGEAFRPEEELPLAPNTRVRITVEMMDQPKRLQEKGEPCCFFKTALSLALEGPLDWAENLDK